MWYLWSFNTYDNLWDDAFEMQHFSNKNINMIQFVRKKRNFH